MMKFNSHVAIFITLISGSNNSQIFPKKRSSSFDIMPKKMHEEELILREGFHDIVHDYVDDSVPTMLKTPQYPAWRPDKVVMQRMLQNSSQDQQGDKHVWHCISAQVLGAEARPFFSSQGETSKRIHLDGKVRTPSDHMAILTELVYTNNPPSTG